MALDLFLEQGYDKTSLREIAERMGFTKAALYYHFSSKADMLMALHQRLHEITERTLDELGDGPVTVDSWARFLDQSIDKLRDNLKLFAVHQRNQSAFEQLHLQGHEARHAAVEDRIRSLFSDAGLSVAQKVRMAASFAAAFGTMLLAGEIVRDLDDDGSMIASLREVVGDILRPVGTAAERPVGLAGERPVGTAGADQARTSRVVNRAQVARPNTIT